MTIKQGVLSIISLGTILSSTALFAATVTPGVEPNAEKVQLRQNCSENNVAIANCFVKFPQLAHWMKTVRKPNATKPLHVSIGPGTFLGANISTSNIDIKCVPADGYTGYVSFNGSGSSQTILQGTGSSSTAAVNVTNCTELNFSNLKITTSFYGGIYWNGGGNSKWSNVEIVGTARAWDERNCATTRGNHYWYSSKVTATAAFSVGSPYVAFCDETWFFGSEIKLVANSGLTGTTSGSITAANKGIIHLYGSNLRTFFDGSGNAAAAVARSGGQIHIHGTGIDVISNSGKDIIALQVETGGQIHADVSAYVLQTTGNISRVINNGGSIRAPYQWAQSNQPPQIISENGADTFIETNCDPSACHDTNTGTETHLLIYNTSCNNGVHGPWFDIVTGRCRGII